VCGDGNGQRGGALCIPGETIENRKGGGMSQSKTIARKPAWIVQGEGIRLKKKTQNFSGKRKNKPFIRGGRVRGDNLN